MARPRRTGSKAVAHACVLAAPLLIFSACEIIGAIPQSLIDARDGGSPLGNGGTTSSSGSSSGTGGSTGSDQPTTSASATCEPFDTDAGKDDCGAGRANCGSAGCAVNLEADPANCGFCNHDCRGGKCELAKCAPVQVADAAKTFGITARNGAVYWITPEMATDDPQRIMSSSGPGKQELSWTPPYGPPDALLVDDSSIYWTYDYDHCVGRAPLDGGPSTAFDACLGTQSGGLAVDATHIYVTARIPTAPDGELCNDAGIDCRGTILKIDKTTKVGTTLADSYEKSLLAIAVDENFVYWSEKGPDSSSIMRCPKAGCGDAGTPETFAVLSEHASELVIDAPNHYLYWISNGIPFRKTTQMDGGDVEPLLAPTGTPEMYYGEHLAIDETFVYWNWHATGHGVMRALKQANQQQLPQDIGGTTANFVAVDCSAVYWTQDDGTVWRLAR